MDCIFYKFSENDEQIIVENDEFSHILAFRLRIGEQIMVTNGDGLVSICKLSELNKKNANLEIIEILKKYGETEKNISLAIGLLDNRDRFEFALEKSIELGITEFIPLISRYSSQKKYDVNRLLTKAIAAICQSKRAVLPKINESIKLTEFIKKYSQQYNNLFLADNDGIKLSEISDFENCCILIGPEGGFSIEEIIELKKINHCKLVNLGIRRLRAETAAIAMISNISLK